MAQTVGQHGVAAFTSPVNGDPLNATVVVANDNATRGAYVDHDSDPDIHVQSSLLASRPAAGTAGRKWMTTDSGAVKLWFDTGSAWSEIAYLPSAGGTVAGNVSITGTLGVTGVLTATGGVVGAVTGNASTATALQTARAINGVNFDGTAAITVTAAAGTLTGATLASNVLASSLTSVGTLAGLTVTAPITGSVTGSSGSTTGNAATATALQTGRAINGVTFDGTAPITVTAAAGTLSGATLASGVTASSLTSVGTLTGLTVTNPIVGSVTGSSGSTTGNAATATALQTARTINGTSFDGTANVTVTAAAGTLTGATLASGVTASSLTSVGTLGSLTVTNPIVGSVTGSSGSSTGNAATATALQTARAINGTNFDGTAAITVTAAAGTLTGATLASNVLASSLTSVGTLAGLTVTAPITGSVTGSSGSTTGNAATATALQTSRNINGTAFNGTADITVTAAAGTLTGATLVSGVTASSLTSVGTLTALTVSGNLAVDTNTLFVDAVNNRVGVGTASPLTRMHINDGTNRNILITTDATQFGTSGMAVGSFTDGAAAYAPLVLIGSTVQVAAGGSIRATLDASGNLGLGASTITAIFGKTLQISDGTVNGSLSLVGSSGNGYVATNGTAFTVSGRGGMSLALGTNDTTKATIDTAGNLGLGVTPSAWNAFWTNIQVHNASFGGSYAVPSFATMASNTFSDGGSYNSGKYIANGFAAYYQQLSGVHSWHTAPSGTAGNAISFTQAMTLDASGNLGIGTAAPSVLGLQVSKTTTAAGMLLSNNANNWLIATDVSTNSLRFVDNQFGAERARIDASGNLGVGTATPDGRFHALNGSAGSVTANANANVGVFEANFSNGISILVPDSSVASIFFGSASSNRGAEIQWGYDVNLLQVGTRNAGASVAFYSGNFTERARIPAAGGVVVGTAALATSATDGFLYVPTCAGTPTGTPTTQTGTAPIIVDTTNNKLYFYSNAAWRDAGP